MNANAYLVTAMCVLAMMGFVADYRSAKARQIATRYKYLMVGKLFIVAAFLLPTILTG